MTHEPVQRQPHAILDLPSRRLKALKIERLLDLHSRPQPYRMLEVGTGSGGIAHYFANHATVRCAVTAVDVTDQRVLKDGYEFQLINSTSLPFPDQSFDVVITNHVIEHVGDAGSQHHHLAEVRRVMGTSGTGYLAVPNRWMLIEPHYRLAFLSWLPAAMRSPYLRAMRRGRHYDCNPPSLGTLEQMLAKTGFHYENICVQALFEILHIEGHKGLMAKLAATLPVGLLAWLSPINPTLIYRLRKQ